MPVLTIATGDPVLTPGEMRAAEAAVMSDGVSAVRLMERAAAATMFAMSRFCPGKSVLVLCGPGNNGGDGYAVACLMRAAGLSVRVAATELPRTELAVIMAARWAGPVESLSDAFAAPVVIDALFGTGLTRKISGEIQRSIDRIGSAATVVAVDIPSGIDAATGELLGKPIAADLTVTFAALKRGHVLGPGRSLCGRIVIGDIGISPLAMVHHVPPPQPRLLKSSAHKFQRGAVVVIAGKPERGGAARLTALAALRAGAGVVTIIGDTAPANAIMSRTDNQGLASLADSRVKAIAIGPGLSEDQRSRDWLKRVLAGEAPAVLDAGAFALLSAIDAVGELAAANAPLILTPHDGEFTRLFGAPGRDRIGAAQAAAIASNAIIILKGAETVIASPCGRAAVNTHASPWLATAGSGDVLTGIVAALVAQGLSLFDAARAGVWLHGDAGIRGGPGLIADDIPAFLPSILASL